MAFLFVDRILSLTPGKHITGVKHITNLDPYLGMVDGRPALLDCIVGETLGQLAAWNVMLSNGFTKRPVAGVAGHVEIHASAFVGQTLFLEAHIDNLDDQAVSYHGEVWCGSQLVMRLGSALGPLLPMTDFIDPAVVERQFRLLHHEGVYEPESSIEDWVTARTPAVYPEGYDHIVEWQAGERAVATKCISGLAPYFTDHFPHRPVYPMTLLLNCHLQLGVRLLGESNVTVKAIRRAKMNQFIEPGDVVRTVCVLKSKTADDIILDFQTTVAGKRVCVVEAAFQLRG